MKKSEIMPFEAAWMQLEIIILSDMSEREQIPYDITSLWNLKYSTNEPIYERETQVPYHITYMSNLKYGKNQ